MIPRKSYILSAILHVVAIILFVVPMALFPSKPPALKSKPIPLINMPLKDKTSSPPKQKKAEELPAPKPEAKPTPPKPEVKPTPAPKEEPKKPTPEKPEPPKVKKPNVPKPEAPKVKKEDKKPDPKKEAPKKKKKPKEEDFLSVLKTVEDLKAPTPEPADKNLHSKEETMDSDNIDDKLSLSELDALKRQLSRCWNLPAGAKNAEDLAVTLEVSVGPDCIVRKAEIQDSGRMQKDPFFKAAAESARRALKHPDCTPLLLPKDQFENWQNFTIIFDPKEMFA